MPHGHKRGLLIAALIVAVGATVTGAWAEKRADQHRRDARAEALTGGHVEQGRRSFKSYGCGGCHALSGVAQAQGRVGPPLTGVAGRAYIAGKLPNRPDALRRWIAYPQGVSPGTAMPDLGVTPAAARDIAAFLYARS